MTPSSNLRRNTPVPLRRRVALAFTLLGFLLSLVFAMSVVVITEDYEHVLAEEILQGQADDYGLRLSNGLAAELPRTHRISGYRADAPDLSPALAAMSPGFHDDVDSDGTHVGVFDTSAGRLVFVIDLSDIEALETLLNLFLAGMVVLGTAIAGGLGWWFAGVALRPVHRLVDEVDALPVQPRPSRLAAHTSHDELGRLARAIDAYQARLVDADIREQAFFADASHELRSPLSVVQGVTEVMLDAIDGAPAVDPAHASRLHRLDRGVRDMGNLVEALLGVARRSELQPEDLDARTLLDDAARIAMPDHRPGIDVDAHGILRAPRREALLLVSGLVRRMARHAPDAPIRIALRDGELVIEQPLDEQPHADAPHAHGATTNARSDTGGGSALLDRLAQRLGWQVAVEDASRIRIRTSG